VDDAAEYDRGFADGVADAEARLAAGYSERLAAHTARIESLLTTMQGQLWHLYERIERDAFRFALAVAGKIIKREVRVDDGTAVRQIQDALRRVVGVDAIKLRVNPTDEQVIREHRPAILASAESVREFIVEPDESIEAGSCIVECASGNVDARWATQLRQVEAALFGRISGILGEQE
jgi:flagellar assembly protein FliH